MTIKDAENEWKSNNIKSNRAESATDFNNNNNNKDEIEMYDSSEANRNNLNVNYVKTNSYQTIDSGYSGSNKSDNSDYEKLYKSNEYVDMSELTHHELEQQKEKLTTKSKSSYQNFLQQFQNTNSNNKINAKLKIVSMRNINTNFNQSKGTSNQNMNQNLNENSLSSSSSSSLISNNDKDNDFRDIKTMSVSNMIDDDYNYLPASYIQRQSTQLTNSRSNSRANSATSNVRNKENLVPTAKTAANVIQTNTNVAAAKKSVTFNNGSNVLEENTMFYYGNKSLDILDVKLEIAVISQVSTISFHYIDYDEFLAKYFSKIRTKFTSAIVSLLFFNLPICEKIS